MSKAAAAVMLLLMVWLTVSLPFVAAAKQDLQEQVNSTDSVTEEKGSDAGVGINEYLHEVYLHHRFATAPLHTWHHRPQDAFCAFHPEHVTPPPDGCGA